jgi:hypothetical protein
VTFLEFLGTASGTGAIGVVGMLGKAALQRRARKNGVNSVPPPSVISLAGSDPKRSFTPTGGMAAVVDAKFRERFEEYTEAQARSESLKQREEQTELLRGILKALGALPEQIAAGFDTMREHMNNEFTELHNNIDRTRHDLRGGQAVGQLETAALAGPERYREVQELQANETRVRQSIARGSSTPTPAQTLPRRMPSRPGR